MTSEWNAAIEAAAKATDAKSLELYDRERSLYASGKGNEADIVLAIARSMGGHTETIRALLRPAHDIPSAALRCAEDLRELVDTWSHEAFTMDAVQRDQFAAIIARNFPPRSTAEGAEVDRLREALRARCLSHNKLSEMECDVCECWWPADQPEAHAPGCLAALSHAKE